MAQLARGHGHDLADPLDAQPEPCGDLAQRVAPDRVISTVDPQARHMHKSRSEYRDGYKAHLAIEPETGLITAAALTPANAADGPNGVALLDREEPGLEVLADSAYGSGQTRADLRAGGHTQTIKPIPLRAAVPGGFTKDDFTFDTAAGTVTCPAGQTVNITPGNRAVFGVRCRSCPLASFCTTRKIGRTLKVHPHEDELIAARGEEAWLREIAPTAGDAESARTLLVESFIGPEPVGLEKLDYWCIFPDIARKVDGDRPVAPFGSSSSLESGRSTFMSEQDTHPREDDLNDRFPGLLEAVLSAKHESGVEALL